MGRPTDRIRASIADPTGAPAALTETPPTWQSDVLIPLTTNLISGIAVGAGVAIVWYLIAGVEGLPSTWWIPVGAVGGLWAIGWTIVRYNGDEIGLFAAAYRAGRHSRDVEVNALHMALGQLREAVGGRGDVTLTEKNTRIARANAALENARTMLEVIYRRGPSYASRMALSQKMGQREWEAARRLCWAAGVIDETMAPMANTLDLALHGVESVHANSVKILANPKSGVAWL